MKTNLKLTKITISKLDNLNFTSLENEKLKNVRGGEPTPSVSMPGSPTVTVPGNDTSHLSSCQFDYDNYLDGYPMCISRDS